MASRLKSLQDRDAAITAEMRKMSDQLAAEDRTGFNEEETAKFDQLTAESKAVQASLKVEQDILAQEKRLAAKPDQNKVAADEAEKPVESKLSNYAIPKQYRSGALKSFQGPNAEERAYRSGMFLLATMSPNEQTRANASRYCRDHGMLAQTGQTAAGGGVLVPEELSQAIIDLREKYGIFRQNVRVMPMGSDTMIVPRRASGVTAYFVSDGVATTESEKGWDGAELVAKELASLIRYPLTLAEDAIISVADDLANEIAYAFALKEDQCGFIGDGTSTYGGITGVTIKINDAQHANNYTTNGGSAGGVKVAAAGHTAFSTLTLSDFEDMVGYLPEYASPNAKWYFSRAGFAASAQRLMDAGGGNTNSSLAAGAPMTFLGYPVVISQVLNATLAADASAIACLFGDLSLAAAMGDRRSISISSSSDRYFEYRQIGIQGVERVDINCHSLGTMTAAGPVIALKKSAT